MLRKSEFVLGKQGSKPTTAATLKAVSHCKQTAHVHVLSFVGMIENKASDEINISCPITVGG